MQTRVARLTDPQYFRWCFVDTPFDLEAWFIVNYCGGDSVAYFVIIRPDESVPRFYRVSHSWHWDVDRPGVYGNEVINEFEVTEIARENLERRMDADYHSSAKDSLALIV